MALREARFVVRADEAGQRLDAYLGRKLRGLSRQRIQRLIREQLTRQDGAGPLKPASVVHLGLAFTVLHEAPEEDPLPEVPILYEDASVLAVDKPAGLAVHPSGRHHLCTLTAALATMGSPRADPAHRLDRETSGLLLCGKGSRATAALKRAFAQGEISKQYLAIAEGWPSRDRFEIDRPLRLGQGLVRLKMAVGEGKVAQTLVEVRERFTTGTGSPLSLLACSPKTGRQHQIRAHLAFAGHPVVGDKIYGPDEAIFIRFTEGRLTPSDQARLRLPRQALHASRMTFAHPVTGEPLSLHSPLPPDLLRFLASLRREAPAPGQPCPTGSSHQAGRGPPTPVK